MKYKLNEAMEKLNIHLTDEKILQFQKYYELLIKWNKVMNLTSITNYNDVVMKHFVDSISIVNAVDMNSIANMIDIGTGAGFPGIPIKIVFPEIEAILLDSLNKRVNFLNTVIDELSLENIYAFHGRAEEYARKKQHREKYDLCVSRAVSKLSTLSEYCLPYVKTGGLFISYKSSEIDQEINESKAAIHILGGQITDIVKFNLPDTDIDRSLVVIDKKRNTDKKYPRKAGIPTKEPLH